MKKALELLANMLNQRGNSAPKVVCVDTGEIATMKEWSDRISEQRKTNAEHTLSYMSRKLRGSKGEAVSVFGLRFAYVPREVGK